MLWFLFHNIITHFTFMEVQTRNLSVFLLGTVIYTVLYSWLGTFSREQNPFFNGIFNFFYYIVLADAFAMGVLYKNYFGRPIHAEVKETLGASYTATNVEPITHIEINEPNIPVVQAVPELLGYVDSGSDYESDADSSEGFAKDSALGEAFNTNGISNADS